MTIPIVYYSGTGNTEAMAKAICEGAEGSLIEISEFNPNDIEKYDKLIFGCPASGAEVLEESVFDPAFTEIENKIKGKKIALFGSYGWGGGQWMKDWEERVINSGAELFKEGLAINDAPDDEALEECREFGRSFKEF